MSEQQINRSKYELRSFCKEYQWSRKV